MGGYFAVWLIVGIVLLFAVGIAAAVMKALSDETDAAGTDP
jgi:hypothetical protein